MSDGKPVRVKVMEIPKEYKDVAGLFEKEGPVLGVLIYEKLVENARPGPSWLIDNLDNQDIFPGRGLADPYDASDACRDVVDVLVVQHPVARTLYVRELASKLDVDEATIRRSLNEAVKARR